MQTQSASTQQVVTMAIKTNINSEERERFLFLCEESIHSHRVQKYAGRELRDAHIEDVYFKSGIIPITHPSFDLRILGTTEQFLNENISLADEILGESIILPDQLTLCRCVYTMKMTGCTPAEAIAAAEAANQKMIAIQRELDASAAALLGALGESK